MSDKRFDVAIIGGGASGLAAAIELGMKAPRLSVAVLEKNEEPARKIRATGSGRCNITNTGAEGYTEILKFFRRTGIMTRTYENGLVYPYSESAADVAELLIARAEELGASIITGAEVTAVENASRDTGRFCVSYVMKERKGRSDERSLIADNVILALGGKAGPSYGTTGDGYKLARGLGHRIVTPVPVLTSIECEEWTEGRKPCGITLAGTRTRGVVTLYKYGNEDNVSPAEIFEESGEIQLTKYGLSGICVFNMTRFMRYDRAGGESLGNFVIKADLFPDGDIKEFLRDRRENAFAGEKTGAVLRTVLKSNIAAFVLDTAGVHTRNKHLGEIPLADLTDRAIDAISSAVHDLAFHPKGIRGWKEAQATSGGVALDELDEMTCESLIVKGLYVTGELADRDFPCGGFNLSNAWITGMKAAGAIADKAMSGADEI
ncbi:MAG: aminoacetone oxidase family FAD-binding enzyme [Mogibacterium sp.]|nr:aminoacetone oxidase family FAD-binding enzyme [Mogibacterium sp.]